MKNIFLALLCSICSLLAFSQTTVERTTDWRLVFEDSKIQLYSKYSDCTIPQEGLYAEYVLLKLVNKTSEQLLVTWYNDTYINGTCSNCDHHGRDAKKAIQMQPFEETEGVCSVGTNNGLRVFSKWLRLENPRTLSMLLVSELKTESRN